MPVTITGTPAANTVYALVGAVVALNASSYVMVRVVPAELTDAEEKIGALKSGATAELFVAVMPVTDNMSLPATSCNAALLAVASSAGAAYETVTVLLEVIVTPEMFAVILLSGILRLKPVIVAGTPLTKMVKAVVAEIFEPMFSLKLI